ncbi:DUF3757 domain-containing protein [Pseudomonas mandelii]|nr:DUF3757 domain-containing protein [Pseudomonas mandelii]
MVRKEHHSGKRQKASLNLFSFDRKSSFSFAYIPTEAIVFLHLRQLAGNRYQRECLLRTNKRGLDTMQTKIIASVLAILTVSNYTYADTCPEPSSIYKTKSGFEAKDRSGHIWKGEDPGQPVDVKTLVFEDAAYITEDETENGPVKVSQLSCRYQNLALFLDNVVNWKAAAPANWDESNRCYSKPHNDCSFSLSN